MDRVAEVTGASGALGGTIVDRLAAAGARVGLPAGAVIPADGGFDAFSGV